MCTFIKQNTHTWSITTKSFFTLLYHLYCPFFGTKSISNGGEFNIAPFSAQLTSSIKKIDVAHSMEGPGSQRHSVLALIWWHLLRNIYIRAVHFTLPSEHASKYSMRNSCTCTCCYEGYYFLASLVFRRKCLKNDRKSW